MADVVEPFATWHRSGVAALNIYFAGLSPAGRRLSESELNRYRGNSTLVTGWRTTVSVDDRDFDLDVVVDQSYPFTLPRIFLVGSHRFLAWPHVEISEKLCLLPDHATFELSSETRVIAHLLDRARELIRQGRDGSNRGDFLVEVSNYWTAGIDGSRVKPFWSIIKPTGPSRRLVCWRGSRFTFLADTEAKGKIWLKNFLGEAAGAPFEFHSGILLWLSAPFYPEEYPKNNSDLRAIATTIGGGSDAVLRAVIKANPDGFPVVFGFDGEEGPAIVGAWSSPPAHSIPNHKSGPVLIKGFRPGKVPQELLANRYLTSASLLEKRRIERCDRAWIHTRGGEGPGQGGRLSQKTVLFIGCGALGGQVGELLVQGGIGRIVLIDSDVLSWNNVGRHILGGLKHIGINKAKALGRELRQRFPELDVRIEESRWQDVYHKDPQVFRDCDVILSTTGDWSSDGALNLLARRSTTTPPLVLGWSEAFACAGHAIAVLDRGGCLACGTDSVGQFQASPIQWDVEPMPQREVGCGAFYQPFGSIATNPINAMIGAVVVDVLQGKLTRSQHRLWVASHEALTMRGGRWSAAWQERYTKIDRGEQMFRFDWPVNSQCRLCQG